MGVSIILITWNRKNELVKTLSYLYENIELFDEVVIVDNGSNDGTSKMIHEQFPQVHLVQLGRNTGVAEARNIGALNAKHEFLLFLDDDGYFDLSEIERMLTRFKQERKLALIACNIIEVPEKNIYKLSFENYKLATPKFELLNDFWGTAFMARKSVFIEAGMFPDYFFYSNEERDLSFRLIRKGYKIESYNNAIMLHYMSLKQRPTYRKTYYYYRNKQFEIWRNLPLLSAVKESLYVIIGGFLRTILTKYFIYFLNGTLVAFLRLPKIIVRDREPLSQIEYKYYKEISGKKDSFNRRIRRLARDLLDRRKVAK